MWVCTQSLRDQAELHRAAPPQQIAVQQTVGIEDPGSPAYLAEATHLTHIISEHARSAHAMYNPP